MRASHELALIFDGSRGRGIYIYIYFNNLSHGISDQLRKQISYCKSLNLNWVGLISCTTIHFSIYQYQSQCNVLSDTTRTNLLGNTAGPRRFVCLFVLVSCDCVCVATNYLWGIVVY